MAKTRTFIGGAACMLSMLGCGPEIENSPPRPQAAAPASQPAEASATSDEARTTEASQPKDAPASESPAPDAPASEASAPAATAETQPAAEKTAEAAPEAMGEREQAMAGVGAKGRGYGGGMVTEPVHQYFTIQQRLVFEDQIPHAMNLYKAQHNDKGPPTHERFMKEIIRENSIPLPELPPGEKYLYDPKTETLMVEHPAK